MYRFASSRRPSTTQYDRAPREISENKKLRTAWLEQQLAVRLAEGFEAKIVGTGSYQSVSYKPAKAVKTRLMLQGICQICQRRIGATNGVIAHHGYERPGSGWQTASCDGARYVPLSESSDRAASVARYWADRAENTTAALAELPSRTSLTMTRKTYRGEYQTVTFTPEKLQEGSWRFYRWADVLQQEGSRLTAELRQATEMRTFLAETVRRQQAGEFAGTTREYEVEA